MAWSFRELDAELRKIIHNCKTSFDPTTGKINFTIISAQAQALKSWISLFETSYIEISNRRPKNKTQILKKGKEVSDLGWFCCEILWEIEIEAGSPEPTMRKWESLPSGLVTADLKATMLIELDKLYKNFKSYRREVILT